MNINFISTLLYNIIYLFLYFCVRMLRMRMDVLTSVWSRFYVYCGETRTEFYYPFVMPCLVLFSSNQLCVLFLAVRMITLFPCVSGRIMWQWLICRIMYFHHGFPVKRRHEAGQTETGGLSDDPAWGNDVWASWRRVERLSNQTCERLCLTLVPLLKKTLFLYVLCVFLHIQGVIKLLCTQQKAEAHMLRAEEEEDVHEKEEGDDHIFTSQHQCPLIQQKVNKYPQCSSGMNKSVGCAEVLFLLYMNLGCMTCRRLPMFYNQLFPWSSQPILIQIVFISLHCMSRRDVNTMAVILIFTIHTPQLK